MMDFNKLEFYVEKAKQQWMSGDEHGAVESLYKAKRLAAAMESEAKFKLHVGHRDAIFIK
ncbi:hypothetical protein [Methanothermococcus okinawensis]|uniref:Uncharacterized protein n=1 Tax=Methanothermococcus okinawensis (strain DSM 14208 / JCM 11175 / IH1) TaxID=647113 RepID=F8ANT9_METOI|nr:hypothetical protein [Methanothermococcus okinawensis]AEH06292.1 hypothetical protein Metok_0302 [Methanothermococcus okinawensis IH1]